MSNFTLTNDSCKEKTTSAWLISVMQFGLKANIFKPFESFKLKMKQVKYYITAKTYYYYDVYSNWQRNGQRYQ
ncbi:hypothetical protein [Clostridium sp. YIM B02569]|uniref:hypothetical protein n=1 Tax=Clostridium sp. YIM B02569 TaxID=2911967 RepID=UPI001EEB86CC|nr:hypothetical protein [Clostridium sp. YIM B02569]